jgi:hypothetical protein
LILNFFYQILICFQYHPWIHPWSWFFFSNLFLFFLDSYVNLIFFLFNFAINFRLSSYFLRVDPTQIPSHVSGELTREPRSNKKFYFDKKIKMTLIKKYIEVLTWFWLLLSWVGQVTGQIVFLIVSHQVSSPKNSFETWPVLSPESLNHGSTHRFN